MSGWLGIFALAFSLCAAVATALLWGRAALRDPGTAPPRWVAAVPLAGALVTIGVLEWALLTHDFALRFVAENGSRSTPTYYTVTSLWAAHDGSLLLWIVILTGYLAATGLRRRVAHGVHAWAMAVLAGTAAFFCGLALFTGHVFDRVSPVPGDGPGPNPLLQDHPAMGIHPPLLYLGLLGMAVPFAYAVAGMITGRVGAAWVATLRSTTLVAWLLLTAGIVMGAWWSYAVLGWGGYWAWDPVENASLLPWLTATALLHGCMVQRKRGALPMWNLCLALVTFLLSCLASFLTRSGVVTSVHSFAESAVGPVLLGFLAALLAGIAVLALLRTDRFGEPHDVGPPLSRGTAITLENLLLVALAATVLIGTLFPVVAEMTTGTKLSVGPPYFNRAALPVALLLLVLMGIGPFLAWRGHSAAEVLWRLLPGVVAGALVVGMVASLAPAGGMALVAFGVAAYVVTGVLVDTTGRMVRSGRPLRWLVDNRHRAAGMVVHVGVVVAVVGIAASSSYTRVVDRTVPPGGTASFAGQQVRLERVDHARDAHTDTTRALLALRTSDGSTQTIRPALRSFRPQDMTVTSPAVVSSVRHDVYVTLLSVNRHGAVTLRLAVNPMVAWIWAGGAVMVLGAGVALWPRRRRPTAPEPAADHDADAVEPAATDLVLARSES